MALSLEAKRSETLYMIIKAMREAANTQGVSRQETAMSISDRAVKLLSDLEKVHVIDVSSYQPEGK